MQKQYGADVFYYQGLKSLEENDIKNAIRFFNKGIKEGGRYTARRSAEELTRLGDIQERLAACDFLVENFPDDKSFLLYAAELSEDKEYATLIHKTDDVDIGSCSNLLVKLRLDAMQKKNDPRLKDEEYRWFVCRPYSQEHYKYFKNDMTVSSANLNYQIIQNFRTLIYTQDYKVAFSQVPVIISTIKGDDSLQFENQIISDLGKACLFGSDAWVSNAKMFDSLAENFSFEGNNATAFYAWFYAARLYEKGGNYYTLSTRRYINAMETSQSDEQYDNALWYLLNLDLGISTDRAIETLQAYCSKWHNSLYFEDFFDTLSVLLLAAHKWNDFYKVYTIIKNYAADTILAKYAYLSGRLLEEGFASPITELSAEEEAESLFIDALHSGSSVYYKVLALERLDLTEKQIESAMLFPTAITEKDVDTAAENLLLGYASFGFPQRIYSEWQRLYEEKVPLGLNCLTTISLFIHNCGDQIPDSLYKSLRIASLSVNTSALNLSKESLALAYPQNFTDFISSSCKEFSVDENLMYALVRSESFFDPNIKSSAGAIGLAQLMQATGADIAKRLKVDEYELTDAATSIRFGTYYLNNLTERLDSSVLLAIFAYNSGITRVRRWVSNSKKELGFTKNLPMDLFLETIPFAETREYGRKIVSASAMYGWLYYGITPTETVRKIVK